MDKYMDIISRNYPLISESSSITNDIEQNGGTLTESDFPTGGFPPILICTPEQKKQMINEEEKKQRGYQPNKSTISIQEIMKQRRIPVLHI